jgi:hypothetical protein
MITLTSGSSLSKTGVEKASDGIGESLSIRQKSGRRNGKSETTPITKEHSKPRTSGNTF